MPHVTRHSKKKKKPKRTQSLNLQGEALEIHRELAALRIAGAAKPGKRRDDLLAKRFRKLDEQEIPAPARITGTDPSDLLALRDFYERRGGRL